MRQEHRIDRRSCKSGERRGEGRRGERGEGRGERGEGRGERGGRKRGMGKERRGLVSDVKIGVAMGRGGGARDEGGDDCKRRMSVIPISGRYPVNMPTQASRRFRLHTQRVSTNA